MDHSHQKPHRATEAAAARAASNIAFSMKDIGLFTASIYLPKQDLVGVMAPQRMGRVPIEGNITRLGSLLVRLAEKRRRATIS
jgi:hypothetical protein